VLPTSGRETGRTVRRAKSLPVMPGPDRGAPPCVKVHALDPQYNLGGISLREGPHSGPSGDAVLFEEAKVPPPSDGGGPKNLQGVLS